MSGENESDAEFFPSCYELPVMIFDRINELPMKKVVVLSGSGISAESGIPTFRNSDGYWKHYRFEEVASPCAWEREPEVVLEFYNMRRKVVFEAEPNSGHRALKELEADFDVQIITQNVDDLHERAGSSHVLHLHGEIKKARSTIDSSLIYTLDHWDLKMGDTCEKGSQLRPHIVWFGEDVTEIENAANICNTADIFIVVGTSLSVYPAAGLLRYCPPGIPMYYVDPIAGPGMQNMYPNLKMIGQNASSGLPRLVNQLLNELHH